MRFLPAFLAACAVVLAGACSEHFPRELQDLPPVDAAVDDAAGDEDGSVADAGDASDAGVDAPAPMPCVDAGPPFISFQPVTTARLNVPVEVVLHDRHLYVLELGGRVLRVNDDGATVSVVLDVSSKIVSGGEAGLLGIAFHPKFATNGFVYLYYTVPHPVQPPPAGTVFQSALVRYRSTNGGLTLDPATATRIMTIDQPFSNHNGGTIAFGNDGFLYWGLGDGGGSSAANAQNRNSLLGKMLRIDVDRGTPYGIPPMNPFATSTDGKRPEIFALGLRNPYRWRFDPLKGDLYAGDVGQVQREEISKITLGGNYGWPIREGKTCLSATTCDTTGLIDPIVDHPRSEASVIIGGVVYRGTRIPALTGKYVYGDFGRRTYYAIPIDDPAPTPVTLMHDGDDYLPSAFALDATGEIVMTDYGGGGLYRLVPPTCR